MSTTTKTGHMPLMDLPVVAERLVCHERARVKQSQHRRLDPRTGTPPPSGGVPS